MQITQRQRAYTIMSGQGSQSTELSQPNYAYLTDPKRIHALKRLSLLDSPSEEAFDRATRLLTKLVNAPTAIVSLLDTDRQFFKSQIGIVEPWASQRET